MILARVAVALALLAVTSGGLAAQTAPAAAPSPAPAAPECGPPGPGGSARCVYRAGVPSVGFLTECTDERDCRVGYYHGPLDRPTWLTPPVGWRALPRPVVLWHGALLGEARFPCETGCAVSYFFDARRRRLSEPRWNALAFDVRRLLVALPEGGALVVRQVFGAGREVARIERPWAGGAPSPAAVSGTHFEPDGRLVFQWRPADGRPPVAERVSIPPVPRGSDG